MVTFDLAALPTCTRCVLSVTRQRVVVGSGPTTPALLIVGEAPGASEDEGGEPFIGRSGRLLFRLLDEELSLRREDCFVTNVVKCRPPNNRVPHRAELEACRGWLDAQLAAVTPRAVVTLGNTAARAVFGGSEPMARAHGQLHPISGVSGLATYHPAAALRGGERVTQLLRRDLQLLAPLLAAS